jgi:hypothetical protein
MKYCTAAVLAMLSLTGDALAQRVTAPGQEAEQEASPEVVLVEPESALEIIETTGQTLYGLGLNITASSGLSYLYRVDNYDTNPQAQVIGDSGAELFDLGIDPTTDRFYAVSPDGNFYELDPATGQASFIGSLGRPDLNALEFDSTGQAWAWGYGGGNLYRIDKETGLATVVGNTGFQSGGDLAFDTNGTLYGTTDTQLIRINRNTGTGTLIGSLGFSGAFGLEIDSDGTMYVGQGANTAGLAQLYRVNKANAATTFIGPISGAESYGLGGLSFANAPFGQALLLRNGRFKVEASWAQSDGSTGTGNPVQLTPDTGYFWFFEASNVELVVKVLDGCGFNNRYWIFASGLTNVNVTLRVTDTLRGVSKTYVNPQGTAFQPIQDTNGFATCP